MARSSPFARRLLPRFGVAWLVVAMLLLISAAGWWTFHRDLYAEEQAVIEQLQRSGAKVAVHRIDYPSFVGGAENGDTSVPWNAPLLDPILMISVQGNPEPEARDAALRLPRLKSYSEDAPPGSKPSPDDWRQVERRLGRPLPELPESTLRFAAFHELLPEGTPVDDAEATRVAAAIREAWRDPGGIPPRRLVVSETTGKADPYEAVSEAEEEGDHSSSASVDRFTEASVGALVASRGYGLTSNSTGGWLPESTPDPPPSGTHPTRTVKHATGARAARIPSPP